MGFIALMAGALFYAARIPVEAPEKAEGPAPVAAPAADASTATPVFPAFSLPGIDGADRNIEEWRGSHLLLNFWATWCAPCRREIPLLKDFQDEFASQGIQVIGIAVDYPDQVAAYAEQAQFNYPIVIGQEEAMAVAETSGVEFIGMPFTMIVASDGELLNYHIGEIFDADLEHIANVLRMLDSGEIDRDAARKALSFP